MCKTKEMKNWQILGITLVITGLILLTGFICNLISPTSLYPEQIKMYKIVGTKPYTWDAFNSPSTPKFIIVVHETKEGFYGEKRVYKNTIVVDNFSVIINPKDLIERKNTYGAIAGQEKSYSDYLDHVNQLSSGARF